MADEQVEELNLDDQSGGDNAAAEAETARITQQASVQGWVPKEDFTGDPAKWVDAATFVERGKNFTKNLKQKVETLEARLANLDKNAKAFQKFHEESLAAKQKELDTALAQLKRDHREAIRDGDDDAADELESRMETLRQEKADLTKQPVEDPGKKDDSQAPAVPPEMQAWIDDGNQWFKDDIRMQAYAITVGQELKAKGETSTGRAFLDKVTEVMREEFPHKFSNPNRQRAGSTESGSRSSMSRAGRTKADLPKEDRELMEQFISEGWTTEEKFLKEYRWS